jgi:hypothetical protein
MRDRSGSDPGFATTPPTPLNPHVRGADHEDMRREIPLAVVIIVVAVLLAVSALVLFSATRSERDPREIACTDRGATWNGSFCVDPSRGLLVGP